MLGVNGSPRKYGGSSILLRLALKAAEKAGARVKLVDLIDYEVKPCIGCLSDAQEACKPPCIIEDELRSLYKLVYDADALILSTPVYWYACSGLMKNFIDRLTVFENMIVYSDKSWLEGKVAGLIAVGNDSGEIMAIAHLMVTLNSMGVVIPPWALAYSRMGDRVLEDESAVKDAVNIGLIVTRMASILRRERVLEWYKPRIEWIQEVVGEVKREVEEEKAHCSERIEFIKRFATEKPRLE